MSQINLIRHIIIFAISDVRFADALVITATFSEPMLSSNVVKLSQSGAAALTGEDMTCQSATV